MIKNRYCLILNAYHQPIRIVNWRTAIRLMFSKTGTEVLEEYDELIRSPSISINVPSVLKLQIRENKKTWMKGRRDFRVFKPSKANIFNRDDGRCCYCEKELTFQEATLDHVLAKSLGGKSTEENLVLSCAPCNLKKSNKKPENAPIKRIRRFNNYNVQKDIGISIDCFNFPPEWLNYLKCHS